MIGHVPLLVSHLSLISDKNAILGDLTLHIFELTSRHLENWCIFIFIPVFFFFFNFLFFIPETYFQGHFFLQFEGIFF